MSPSRPLLKGPLHPPGFQRDHSATSYSQPVVSSGELYLDKKPKDTGVKGVTCRVIFCGSTMMLTICRKEVIFDSGKLPQPFLDPKVMDRRKREREEARG